MLVRQAIGSKRSKSKRRARRKKRSGLLPTARAGVFGKGCYQAHCVVRHCVLKKTVNQTMKYPLDGSDEIPTIDYADEMGRRNSAYSLQVEPPPGTSPSQEVTEPKDTVWMPQQEEQRGFGGGFPAGGVFLREPSRSNPSTMCSQSNSSISQKMRSSTSR